MQNTARSSCSLITVNSVITNPMMNQTQQNPMMPQRSTQSRGRPGEQMLSR